MLRVEHNAAHGVERRPDEPVGRGLSGEANGYDSACAKCWAGLAHTWAEHDRSIGWSRLQEREAIRAMTATPEVARRHLAALGAVARAKGLVTCSDARRWLPQLRQLVGLEAAAGD